MADIQRCRRKRKKDVIYVRQRYTDADGKKRQKKIRCESLAEAKAILPEVEEAEKDGKLYMDTRPAVYSAKHAMSDSYGHMNFDHYNMTVSDLLPCYFQYAAEKGEMRPHTLTTKLGIAKNYIDPLIGSTRLLSITPSYMQDYFDDLPNHPAVMGNHKHTPGNVSLRQVAEIRKILSRAFRFAVINLRTMVYNPITSDVTIPKPEPNQLPQWTEEEFVSAVNAEDEDSQLATMMLLMAAGPLRAGETTGLLWDCVHIPENHSEHNPAWIEIKRELQSIDVNSLKATRTVPLIIFPQVSMQRVTKTRLCLVEWTKTRLSKRKIYLPEKVTERLLRHKVRQEDLKALYGDRYTDYGLVFALEQRFPGRPISNGTINKLFKRLKDKTGLPDVRWYSLRATGTSQKMRATDNPKLVQADMGGDTERLMMETYAMAEEKDRKELASKMNNTLFHDI